MTSSADHLPRSALVTGGGDGIGRAICVALAQLGCSVTVADVNLTAAEETVELCGGPAAALGVACDVTDEEALGTAFTRHAARWGEEGPMLTVCNAGVSETKRDWQLAVRINLFGVIATTQLALARMRKAHGGVVVCVGSMGGYLPMADQPVYAATKAGVLMYVRSLAESLQLDGECPGIRICGLAPAIVETALSAQQRAATRADRAAASDAMLQQRGGLLAPSRIAEACVRLAATAGCNGSVLRVFQDGTLKFLVPTGAYPWSPRPPEALAAMPAPRTPGRSKL